MSTRERLHPVRCIYSGIVALLLAWGFECTAHAQFGEPALGGTLQMKGVSYEWNSGDLDGSGRRVDIYRFTTEIEGQPQDFDVSVTSAVGSTGLALVSGEKPGDTVVGYLRDTGSGLVYAPYVRSTSPATQLNVRGVTYTLSEATFTAYPDLDTQDVVEYPTSQNYTSGVGKSFTVAFTPPAAPGDPYTGIVTGDEDGHVIDQTVYISGIKRDVTSSNLQRQVNNGAVTTTYKAHEVTDEYTLDSEGVLITWCSAERWVAVSDPSRVVTVTAAGHDQVGVISGSEAGGVLNGSWHVNYQTPMTNIPTASQGTSVYFGVSLVAKRRSESYQYTPGGDYLTCQSTTTTEYEGSDSAAVTSIQNSGYVDSVLSGVVDSWEASEMSGWTRQVGSFGGAGWSDMVNYQEFTWSPRTESLYASRNLMVDGILYTFSSGSIDSSASSVVDTYVGPNGEVLSIGNPSAGKASNPYQHFVGGNPVYAGGTFESIWEEGDCHPGTSGLLREGTVVIGSHIIVPAVEAARTTPFFLEETSIYVDGQEYLFEAGFDDADDNHADVYVGGEGKLSLYGRTVGNADVILNGFYTEGGLENEEFNVPNHAIMSEPPIVAVFPKALWVDGQVWPFIAQSSTANMAVYTDPSGSQQLALTSVDAEAQTYMVSGTETWLAVDDPNTPEDESVDSGGNPRTESASLYSGTIEHGTGIFLIQRVDGLRRVACALNVDEDGHVFSFLLPPPAANGLPPGLLLSPGQGYARRGWVYVGHADLGEGDFAYYGSVPLESEPEASGSLHPWPSLAKMALPTLDGNGEAMPQAVAMKLGSLEGTYLTSSRLFQTSRDAAVMLRLPVFAVAPATDFTLWRAVPAPAGLPQSFRMADGQIWRFSHEDEDGRAIYLGHHDGQQLALDPVGDDGYRLAHLTDTENQIDTQGTFSNERQAIHMRNGMLVYVNAADEWGDQGPVILPQNQLYTIAGDLDITGNIVTFGALLDDASRAGVVLQFQDRDDNGSFSASLHSIVSRTQAEWTWQRAANDNVETTQKVMHLDTGHRLSIYSAGDRHTPAILLDPSGASYLKGGPLRVLPAGDVPMATDFRQGPVPGQ